MGNSRNTIRLNEEYIEYSTTTLVDNLEVANDEIESLESQLVRANETIVSLERNRLPIVQFSRFEASFVGLSLRGLAPFYFCFPDQT